MSSKLLLSAGLVSALVLSGCAAATPEAVPVEETTPVVETTDSAPGEAMDGVVIEDAMMEGATQVSMEMSNFKFSVDEITASPGEKIVVNLTNTDGFHDFVIDELGVKTEVIETGGETQAVIEIPADAEPGTTYAFYCSVGQHRANGMEGTITVQ